MDRSWHHGLATEVGEEILDAVGDGFGADGGFGLLDHEIEASLEFQKVRVILEFFQEGFFTKSHGAKVAKKKCGI